MHDKHTTTLLNTHYRLQHIAYRIVLSNTVARL